MASRRFSVRNSLVFSCARPTNNTPSVPVNRAKCSCITSSYRYDISILQAEFSLTQMLDKPVAGRVFFEQVIRDNLDIGRPDQVVLIFDRRLMRRGKRPTPGRFRPG